MNVAPHFSSHRATWATPRGIFDDLHAEFGFTLDACATAETALCPAWYGPKDNALWQPWHEHRAVWCNPPYGRSIGLWLKKAWESAQAGATVVCLIPSRTDARWWHDIVMTGEIRFIRGRLKFGDAKYNAPFPSCVVVFRPKQGGGAE